MRSNASAPSTTCGTSSADRAAQAAHTLYGTFANTEADGTSSGTGNSMSGIDQLGAAMIVAAVVATPFGITGATPTFVHPDWLLWGIGVGLCSSVIPYITDQLAMARLPPSR